MTERNGADSKLTEDEAKYMMEALMAIPDRSKGMSDWFKEEYDKATSSFINVLATSLDPTKNGFDLAIEVADFRNNRYFRMLGFTSFAEWCKAYSFSGRTISRYWKTFCDLSVDRSIDLEIYEHLSPTKIAMILKSVLSDEPKYNPSDPDPTDYVRWLDWADRLKCLLKAAKCNAN